MTMQAIGAWIQANPGTAYIVAILICAGWFHDIERARNGEI